MQHGQFTIELTPEENALADAIKFDPHGTLGNTIAFHANGDLVVQLVDSLLNRKVIPDHRLSYFTDPEFNPGGHGLSREARFLGNAGNREKMIRHGHFLQYLHYFIHGAQLPTPVLSSFASAVEACGFITSGDLAPLSSTARQLVRSHGLDSKEAAEEFFKLCLDLEMSPSDAASIRSSILKIRTTR
jgi:hypothetical protein